MKAADCYTMLKHGNMTLDTINNTVLDDKAPTDLKTVPNIHTELAQLEDDLEKTLATEGSMSWKTIGTVASMVGGGSSAVIAGIFLIRRALMPQVPSIPAGRFTEHLELKIFT